MKAQHDREIVLKVYYSGLLYHDIFKTQAFSFIIPYHNYQNFIRKLKEKLDFLWMYAVLNLTAQ